MHGYPMKPAEPALRAAASLLARLLGVPTALLIVVTFLASSCIHTTLAIDDATLASLRDVRPEISMSLTGKSSSEPVLIEVKGMENAIQMLGGPLEVNLRHTLDESASTSIQRTIASFSSELGIAISELRMAILPIALREEFIPDHWNFIIIYSEADSAWTKLYQSGSEPFNLETVGIRESESPGSTMTKSVGIGMSIAGRPPLRLGVSMTPSGIVEVVTISGSYYDYSSMDNLIPPATAADLTQIIHEHTTGPNAKPTSRSFRFRGTVEQKDLLKPWRELMQAQQIPLQVDQQLILSYASNTTSTTIHLPAKNKGQLSIDASLLLDNAGNYLIRGPVYFQECLEVDIRGRTLGNKVQIGEIFAAPRFDDARDQSSTSTMQK